MSVIEYRSIGIIHSPFTQIAGMPIQPAGARGVEGTVEVEEQYAGGLKDLEGFSHIHLIYHFHRSEGFDLQVVPFLDNRERGVLATRAPRRPNPIGLSTVRLLEVNGNILTIANVDILDGTPLLDIKPAVPEFELLEERTLGWLENSVKSVSGLRSDKRFRK
ncbi:MAG TPA: tRNA (N6-threonylcarbamoyladenosine(37)-N6)-methyltransferase TrmO [bacterium]|nr:tRNA (N6-threonylcarbamoyladenosine(37)-N6)-methyltransferase TrmO [bacterium]